MTANKKLGNYTGAQSLPTSSGAAGSWVSASEVYSQQVNSQWPSTPIPERGAWIQPGDLVYAVASNVVTALTSGIDYSYVVASGQAVSRALYSNLFSIIGEKYGPGDGVSTFNVAPMMPVYGYTKCTTIDGALSASGVGVLPSHTHTVTRATSQFQDQASEGGGATTNTVSFTFFTNNSGGADNHGRHVEIIPLMSNTSETAPVGTVIPCLTPNSVAALSEVIPSNCVVASGQALSRTTYSELFQRLGTLYGNGNGSTTFNIPDFRGVFLRSPVGRVTIQPSGYTTNVYGSDNYISHRHGVSAYYLGGGSRRCDYIAISTSAVAPASGPSSVGGGVENRPANITCTYLLVVSPY